MLSGHWSPPHISAPLGIQLSRCMLGTVFDSLIFSTIVILLSCRAFICFTCRNLTGIRFYKTCIREVEHFRFYVVWCVIVRISRDLLSYVRNRRCFWYTCKTILVAA